jgi:hypothetical protein
MGEECIWSFSRKFEGKGPLGRPRYRWDDNIKVYIREMGYGCGEDSSSSGQGPVAGFCEHGYEPLGFIICWKFVVWLSNCWLLKKDWTLLELLSEILKCVHFCCTYL